MMGLPGEGPSGFLELFRCPSPPGTGPGPSQERPPTGRRQVRRRISLGPNSRRVRLSLPFATLVSSGTGWTTSAAGSSCWVPLRPSFSVWCVPPTDPVPANPVPVRVVSCNRHSQSSLPGKGETGSAPLIIYFIHMPHHLISPLSHHLFASLQLFFFEGTFLFCFWVSYTEQK